MINTAIEYLSAGLSVIPVKIETKQTTLKWKKYQSERMTPDQAFQIFAEADGIAIICGEISGNLEVIDLDNHQGTAKQNFDRLTTTPELRGILNGMVAETTQSGGYHLIYRCETIGSNQKIAQTLFNGKPDTIIESRAQGGYIVSAPSKGYNLIGKSDLTKIKTITTKERIILFEHLNSFNEFTRPDQQYHHETFNSTSERPGDAYNNDNTSIDDAKTFLIDAGWRTKNGTYWTRPDKSKGVSATFGKCTAGGIQLFYCFSSNAYPFEDRKSYTSFQIFAILKHGSDFSEAAKELALKGYGKQSNPQYQSVSKKINEANKKGVKQKEAVAAIESDLPDEKVAEIAKKIYDENKDEHGFDKKPAIEKAEIFLSKNYEFRRNVVTDIEEMQQHSTWIDVNEHSIYRNLQYNYIKFGMDSLKSLIKSDYVPDYNPFVEYFDQIHEYSGEDYFLKFAGYVIEPQNQAFFANMLRKHFVRAIKCALNDDYYNRIVFTFFSKNQEIGKSWMINWFNPFGSKYYTDEFLKDTKDSLFALAENFIYNLEELDQLSKFELGKLKATIAKKGVKDRQAYATRKKFMPRRCTFFGSTNRDEFLVDDSNTRWIIFKTDTIDWKYSKDIKINDMWSEAFAYYNDPDFNCELTKSEKDWRDETNETYQVVDIERSMLIKYFQASETTFMTNAEIMMKLGEISAGRIRLTTTPQKIGRIISSLGFIAQQKRINGKNTRVYFIEPIIEPFSGGEDAPF